MKNRFERSGDIREVDLLAALVALWREKASATLDFTRTGVTGGFEHELLEEFVRAVSATSRSTIHLEIERGRGAHHIIEAGVKALARALRVAVSIDPAEHGVPSTKGTLTE